FRNRLAKLLPHRSVLGRLLESALGDPRRHRRDADPPALPYLQHLVETTVELAQEFFFWNAHLFKLHVGRIRSPHPKLIFNLADSQPRCSTFHNKCRDPLLALRWVR